MNTSSITKRLAAAPRMPMPNNKAVPQTTSSHGMTAATAGAGVVPVAVIQMTCSEDPGENLARALGRIEEAARSGARVVCLQELFRSLGAIERVRRDWPFLRDRRIDAYADLEKRFRD